MYETVGGQQREGESFVVLKREGVNMAHRSIQGCISRAIVAGIRHSEMGVSLDQGRVLVFRNG